MSKILYTVATDKNGNLIKANDAAKGDVFFCPICKTDMILRKSGKTGKGSKRPHFAHKALTINCTPETALHHSFKTLLADKIEKLLSTNSPLPVSWHCEYCNDMHSGNLLRKIRSVKVEHHLTVCKSDIALFDENRKVFAVIEIVVTHKPEEAAISFYSSNGIILIRIDLISDEDVYRIDEKIGSPDFVATCYNPKCNTCGHFQQKKRMTIIDGPCWKCGETMKIATISTSTGSLINGSSNNLRPSEFSDEELALARSKGVILQAQYSRTVGESYVANTCPKCGTFAGDFYLFTQYISPSSDGRLPSQTFDIGYHCDHCSNLVQQWTDENDGFGDDGLA